MTELASVVVIVPSTVVESCKLSVVDVGMRASVVVEVGSIIVDKFEYVLFGG